MAEQRPLVLVFEDLHWADDSLLDFVDYLVTKFIFRTLSCLAVEEKIGGQSPGVVPFPDAKVAAGLASAHGPSAPGLACHQQAGPCSAVDTCSAAPRPVRACLRPQQVK